MNVPADPSDTVEIVTGIDTWDVLVTEGGEVTQHMFELESFAVSFATGQRIRLGLSTRSIPPEVRSR